MNKKEISKREHLKRELKAVKAKLEIKVIKNHE